MKNGTGSILQTRKECYICRTQRNLIVHHVYAGSRRQTSDRLGCVVSLCAEHHNMYDFSVHVNHDMDMTIKKDCQRKFEELYGHDKFMEEFGKNYL